jgi:aromatic-L-amino-acid decarboxylase
MTPEEFRASGHQLIDWIADYMRDVERYPVRSPLAPGEVRAALPEAAPQWREPFADWMRDVERILLPGITHWQSPRFFAFFPANNSGPSVLGELLAAGLGVQGMLWVTSPACTELEQHVLDWLVPALGLPDKFTTQATGGGVIQDSASSATLCALLAARERATAGESNRRGLHEPLVAYASVEAHSSVEKAMMIAGLGRENLRKIPVDQHRRLQPEALRDAIRHDLEQHRRPCFLVGTIGTTSTGAVDPIPALAAIAQQYGLWLHVDAAMFGAAAVCAEYRSLHAGVEGADSYCFNPHKWLLVNFDCDCFYVADRTALTAALSILPEYLRHPTGDPRGTDLRDWQIPLGRRFRALKLWFVLRGFGLEGLQALIRRHVELAEEAAAWIQEDARFELATPPQLNLVCFRHRDGNAATEHILERVNASGEIYLSHTKLDEHVTLRLCIGQATTQLRHVEQAWECLQRAADEWDRETATGQATSHKP